MGRKLPKQRSLRRGKATRDLKYVIHIFCEGKTEKAYLEELAHVCRQTGATVSIVGQQGVPKTLVEKAKDKRTELERERRAVIRRERSSLAGSYEVWVVCDRDEHPRYVEAAIQAADNQIGFAHSNPCVELWAVLHFQDQTSHIERKECQRLLSSLMPRYHHDRSPYFVLPDLTASRVADAKKRALHLAKRREEASDGRGNPSTELWKLVDVLNEGSSVKARILAEPELWADTEPGHELL